MIGHDALEKVRLASEEACKAAKDRPAVSVHGAMSALVLLPDGLDAETVAEDIFSRLEGVATDYIMLSEWYDINGECWTEEEARTILLDVRKDMCEFSKEEIAAHRKEHVIEIDPKWKNGSEIVYMPIKREFFNAIARNEKKFEWRNYCETWVKKIIGPRAKFITFQNGYAKNAPKMVWRIKDVKLADSAEEGTERYSPYDIPPMAEPRYIVIELGSREL